MAAIDPLTAATLTPHIGTRIEARRTLPAGRYSYVGTLEDAYDTAFGVAIVIDLGDHTTHLALDTAFHPEVTPGATGPAGYGAVR